MKRYDMYTTIINALRNAGDDTNIEQFANRLTIALTALQLHHLTETAEPSRPRFASVPAAEPFDLPDEPHEPPPKQEHLTTLRSRP